VVYAVVRAGGRQEKVEVGSIITIDRIAADKDANITLTPVLLVDGDAVTHDPKVLSKVTVTAEVLGDLRGPKITIHKFKNKSGYHKRQGFRSELTRVKITDISRGK
jgi:large subunit ribosomal protein L21